MSLFTVSGTTYFYNFLLPSWTLLCRILFAHILNVNSTFCSESLFLLTVCNIPLPSHLPKRLKLHLDDSKSIICNLGILTVLLTPSMPQLSLISLLRSQYMFVGDCWKSVLAHSINTSSPTDSNYNSSPLFHKPASHLYFQSHPVKPPSTRLFSYKMWVIFNSFCHSWLASLLIPIESRSKRSNIINSKMIFLPIITKP